MGAGKDKIFGGSGFDLIFGGAMRDIILAGDGFNMAFGDEVIIPLGFSISPFAPFKLFWDIVNPWGDSITFTTNVGDDTILGGNFADIFIGGGGNDDLRGYGNNDLLFGNDGDDILSGGDFSDILDGGTGNDWLDGGAAVDVLIGDLGRNNFVFSHWPAEADERTLFWKGDFHKWKDNGQRSE